MDTTQNPQTNSPQSNLASADGLVWMAVGALVLALAVMLGAFGAHGLKETVSAARMAVYQTAVQYHFYHGLGLLLLGLVMQTLPALPGLRWVARLLLVGIMLFSGSLYMLVFLDLPWLGMVTPIGGLLFIVAWLLFAQRLLKQAFAKT